MANREPNVKDQTQGIEMNEVEKEFVEDLRKKIVEFDIDATQTWRDKMMTARNQRQGIKRVSNVPYPGAPDIPLPETDKLIRKHKPNFVLSAVSGKNFMSVKALEGVQEVTDRVKDMARKSEIAMNFIFRDTMPWIKRLTLATDRFLEKGLVNFKIIENFKSRAVSHTLRVEDFDEQLIQGFKDMERAEQEEALAARFGFDFDIEKDEETVNRILKEFNEGKEVIEFHTEDVSSFPEVIIPTPEKVFVPKGTTDLGTSTRITHEFFVSEHDLWSKGDKGIYDKGNVKAAIARKNTLMMGDEDINEKLKERQAGVSDNETLGEMFRVHETYTWFQPKKDGPFERWVFTFLADVATDEEALIQKIPFPFDELEEWNWERHDNEILDENHYRSRGIPEQIRAIQEVMERSINNILVRDETSNNPMYKVLSTSKLLSSNVRFVPGQKVRVDSMDEIQEMSLQHKVDIQSERIMQLLKATAEEYIGGADQLFRNATNAGGGKTLGEIQEGIGQSQFLLSLDIANWLDTLRRVYTKVFKVMKERFTGILFVEGERITREDFQFIPDIRPNGSLEEADKQLQAQKSLVRLNLVRQAKSDGVATVEDIHNAYTDYLEKDGVVNTEEFLTDPEEILNDQIQQLEKQAQQLFQQVQQQNEKLQEGTKNLDKNETKLKEQRAEVKALREVASETVLGGGNGRGVR